ncbi:MAG: carbohydrate-binding family 9-like protein, partial [Kiritimatiellae bacterium]|nr:carbohydrate-binding family 9-like protein [Kiritimatiellia bacterium]
DSCVEFFVSFDRVNFYNLEVNCIGTAHLGYGPSRHGRKFVLPELMNRIGIHSSLGDKPFEEKSGGFDWHITLKVPLEVFMFDGLTNLSGMVAAANLYKIGDALAVPHYLSWMPVLTPKPDYHSPEFFGSVRFG